MAIKVIKHGKVKWPQRKICKNCGCEFEFDEKDLHIDYSLCLTSYPVQYKRYVICPDCGEVIFVDTISSTEIEEKDYPNPSPIKVWYDGTIYNPNPCEGCINNRPLDTVVGDNPCSRCKYRQITCSYTTGASKLEDNFIKGDTAYVIIQ